MVALGKQGVHCRKTYQERKADVLQPCAVKDRKQTLPEIVWSEYVSNARVPVERGLLFLSFVFFSTCLTFQLSNTCIQALVLSKFLTPWIAALVFTSTKMQTALLPSFSGLFDLEVVLFSFP